MPKRPNQHQIEDISRAKFKLAMPRAWVVRDIDKDYGVDCEVEIFDSENKTTGLIFLVQLKATESTKEGLIKNVDIEIDRLLYYKQLDLPVLLVRYSVSKDIFLTKWVNNVDLFSAKDAAKKFRIKFGESNKLNTELIQLHLIKLKKLKSGSFMFPLPITIEILESKINNVAKAVILTQVRKYLGEHTDFVKIEGDERDSLIQVNLDTEKLFITACNYVGCTYHSIQARSQNSFSIEIGQDILLGIAVVMLHLKQVELCGRIIFECNLESRLLEKEELLLFALPKLLHSSYFHKILSAVEPILDNSDFYEVDLLTKVGVLLNSNAKGETRVNAIEKFLIGRIESSISIGNKRARGISNYNLGNYYRSRGMNDKALKHYLEAKRNESIYLNQHYFYSELAGVFFGMDRFRISSKLYSKSIELGAPTRYKALNADALMFCGKYADAMKLFNEYLVETDKPISEFVLKAFCLNKLLSDGCAQQQIRDQSGANQFADISRLEEKSIKKEQFEKALDLDLLCGLAWFNLGICYNIELKNNLATFSFSMAGLIYTTDIEAWVNATICSLTQEETAVMFPLIVRVAYHFNKQEYLGHLYDKLNNSGIPEPEKLIETIEAIIQEDKVEDDTPVVRMLNGDGIFENLV